MPINHDISRLFEEVNRMTVKEILKEYRKGDLEFKLQQDLLDEDTTNKVRILNKIFEDANWTSYKIESIKVVRMYYKEISSARAIANTIHVSERHVYRMRDSCVEWLSDLLDNYPPVIQISE